MKISVIGAGLGGLAVAALLAGEADEVTVYEKNSSVGGKMGEHRSRGFRFDTGPSLLTLPGILEELFRRCGSSLDTHLTLLPIDPLCRYFYSDGTSFDNYHDRKKSLAEIRRIAPEDEDAYLRFLDYSKNLYSKTAGSFLFNPLHNFEDLRRTEPGDFLGIDAFSTVAERIDLSFRSSYLRTFFKRFTTYNGSSPFLAPATLNVIPHIEIDKGGYYVKGGIYRIAEALFELARSRGVRFRLNSEVTRIRSRSGKASGLELSDGTVTEADLVISNADASRTYLNLLSPSEVSFFRKKILAEAEPSCSGFVIMLGTNRSYEKLRHHNVFFSSDYETEFKTIFEECVPSRDPTIYIANTSYSEPEHAVEGGSNFFVLVNAPYVTEKFEWDRKKEDYARFVVRELESRGLEGLSNAILSMDVITPKDFQQKFYSNRGSIYGTSSNSRLSAFVRPGNKARSIDGLYLTGGSTHPGGGIPLVILSALNVYELVQRYEHGNH